MPSPCEIFDREEIIRSSLERKEIFTFDDVFSGSVNAENERFEEEESKMLKIG